MKVFGVRLMMLGRVAVWVAAGVWAAVLAGAVEPDSDNGAEGLEKKLNEVRRELEKTSGEVTEVNRRFVRLQHDLVYTNSTAAGMYNLVKELEQKLAAAREGLSALIEQQPEVKEAGERRKKLYDRIAQLKERELVLAQALQSQKWKALREKEKEGDKAAGGDNQRNPAASEGGK